MELTCDAHTINFSIFVITQMEAYGVSYPAIQNTWICHAEIMSSRIQYVMVFRSSYENLHMEILSFPPIGNPS